MDTGCSTTLTSERSDFITYEKDSGKVEGLGTHDIVGTGTVKYTVLDDNGNPRNIIIHDAIHVPSLEIRLISVQQWAQQNKDPLAGGHILSKHLLLRWDGYNKTVPYNCNSNLPILYTVPGGKRATAYISKHIHTYAYKLDKKRTVRWDDVLIKPGANNSSPELIDNPQNTILKPPSNLNNINPRKDRK